MEEIKISAKVEHTDIVDTVSEHLITFYESKNENHEHNLSTFNNNGDEEDLSKNWMKIIQEDELLNGKDFKTEDLVWLNELKQSKFRIEEYLIKLTQIKHKLLFDNYPIIYKHYKTIQHVQKVLTDLAPYFAQRDEYVDEIKYKFLGKAESLKQALIGVQNSIKAENLVQKARLLFKTLKQIHMTLNPLALSFILKENEAVLDSHEDFRGIEEIENKLHWVSQVKDELRRNTEKRFNEAFEAKDQSSIKMCVQIFFNMGILNEKIQTVANNVLRTLFTRWKMTVSACHEKIGTFIKKDDEKKFVEHQIKEYANEVCKYTLQLYNLCISLRERSAKSYETLEDSLKNSGLNNLFHLFWDRVCRIYSQSILKISQNTNYTQQAVYKVFIENYPTFHKTHNDLWIRFSSETLPTGQIIFNELKVKLFESITILRSEYIKQSSEMFNSMLDKIYQKLI